MGFLDKSKRDIKYLSKKSSELKPNERRRKRSAIALIIGLIIVLVQLIITGLFALKIISMDILPLKYLIMLNVILFLLFGYCFSAQFTKANGLAKFISIFMSAVMLYTYLAAGSLNSALNAISNDGDKKTVVIDIIVLENDSASKLEDIFDYTMGYNGSLSSEDIITAVNMIQENNDTTLNMVNYQKWNDLFNALKDNKQIKSIIMEHSVRESLREEYEDFYNSTRVLTTIQIDKKIENLTSNKDVTSEPFVIYVSGISSDDGADVPLTSNALSDVNILVVINPKTRQVLMVSTPRDFYIPISTPYGPKKEKLTHAGNFGVENSMKTLSTLYDISIDYYYKINFAGCVSVVNALGGITVESEVAFTNGDNAAPINYTFVKGSNYLDGDKALAFCRERDCFREGDLQRGRNQMAAIKAMINKCTSPAILTSYGSVLDAVSDMVITNMTTDKITSLVKAQLADMSGWNIQTYSAGAERTGSGYMELYDFTASVVYPDYESVNTCKELIKKVYNGEIVDVDAY